MKIVLFIFVLVASMPLLAQKNMCQITIQLDDLDLVKGDCNDIGNSCFSALYQFLGSEKLTKQAIVKCQNVSDMCFNISHVVFEESIKKSAGRCAQVDEQCFVKKIDTLTLENAIKECRADKLHL